MRREPCGRVRVDREVGGSQRERVSFGRVTSKGAASMTERRRS